MIELRALGTLVLRHSNGEDVQSVLAQPKRVALLAYLVVARPLGFHRRDTLLALLWPEQDEQHARWALNQALRHLRGALGKQVVVSRGDGEVGVDQQCLSCDVVEFETAIEQGDQAHALSFYHGDFLEGFHVAGCGDYERWLEEERVWLRRRAARAASDLAQLTVNQPAAAGHWARQALALSPDDESEARRLIELLDRMGDRAGAVQAYQEFARRLRGEYEVEPAPETQSLIAAVRARKPAPRAETPSIEQNGRVSDGTPASAAPDLAAVQAVPRGRGRRVSLALGSLLVAGVALIWGQHRTRPLPASALQPNTIAVFPFAYRGDPGFAYLGEGMLDLLSADLNGAGEIRTVDPQTVLAVAARPHDQPPGPDQAHQVIARLRAGSFVLGDVVEAGGRLRITARLYSVSPRERPPVSVSVQGAPGQLFQLVDGLTAQLIAGRSGSASAGLTRLAALTTDSLSALKAYLEAERHFRAWRLDSCLQALDRAVRIDSSFALAHYRMATAALWTRRRGQASQAADLALRYANRLSDRDRRLLQAFAAGLHGRNAEAEHIYREIVSRYPNDVEANFQLGDLIESRSSLLGLSWLDAREPFERVLSVQPDHHDVLFHLSGMAARERRLGALDSLTQHALQILPPPDSWFFRGQRALVFGDTAELTRVLAAMQTYGEAYAQPLGGLMVFTTGDLATGRRIWRMFTEPSRSRGVRVLAYVTLAKIEVMSGRWNAAQKEIDAAGVLDSATALEHRVLLSLWPLFDPPASDLRALRTRLLRWKAPPEPVNETSITGAHGPAHPYLRLFLLGLLSARVGEATSALHFAAELDRRARASFAPIFVGDLAQTVRAEAARARGRLGEALAVLDSTRSWNFGEVPQNGTSTFYDYEYQQFMWGELLYALGRYDEALKTYRGMADQLFHSGAPAHFRMAQIYDKVGDRQKAADHYARFVELWKDCDPEFRSLVEEARRRMSS
jgi:DNA-binding SARP family transcriptional activator/tetratricopeptide (TPR) repeat protein